MGRDEDQRALAGEPAEQLRVALDRERVVHVGVVAVEQIERQVRRVHDAGEHLRDDARGHAVDARVEVARHVVGHVARDGAQGVDLLRIAHARDAPCEALPEAEALARLGVALLTEAADLGLGGLVEGILELLTTGLAPFDDAVDHVAHDLFALGVEPEDGRVAGLGHVGPKAR